MNWSGFWFGAIFLAATSWGAFSMVKWIRRKWHGWLEYLRAIDEMAPGMIRAIEEGYKRGENIQSFKAKVLAEAEKIIEESRSRNEDNS